MPNLNIETRLAMESRLSDPKKILESTVIPRVRAGCEKYAVYGEKDVTFGPFIPYLYEMLESKFVFIKRDGRDVVRSLIDWHERMFGSIYRECYDAGNLSSRAISSAANLPVHLDTSDYSRPRPLPESTLFEEWEYLTREEMSAYYWSTINNLYLEQLAKIPQEAWIEIDYTRTTVEEILRVADFLQLTGLERGQVQTMLDMRINSLEERNQGSNRYPDWKHWDSGQRDRFDKLATKTMERLGYYDNESSRWKPIDYGRFWHEQSGDIEWYQWMYDSRYQMHKDLVDWIHQQESKGESIQSVVDLGCGLGVGYSDDLADYHYVGVDLSPDSIQWCQQNRHNPNHAYLCVDFITEPLPEQYDLVMSSGTIDNIYDVEAYLKAMVRASTGWIYFTCYRGWFPDQEEHHYTWSDEHQCFYTDISARQVRATLENLGCSEIIIEPVRTSNQDIRYETRVIARVPERTGHETHH
jgi:SAM-dependent methyltransferase